MDYGAVVHMVGPGRVSWAKLVGLDLRGLEHECAMDDVDGVHCHNYGDDHVYHDYYGWKYCN